LAEKEKVADEMLDMIKQWERSNPMVTESFYKFITLQTEQMIE
jgi:hypothetical protein